MSNKETVDDDSSCGKKKRKSSGSESDKLTEFTANVPPEKKLKVESLQKNVQAAKLFSIKLNATDKKPTNAAVDVKLVKTDKKIKAVFNSDEESSEETEMPAEARMKMRNIGRETPTSSGPNSFCKGKQGFIDYRKLHEKHFKDLSDDAA